MASSLIPALAVTTPATDAPPSPVTDGERSGLLHALTGIPDPRDPRGVRYPLAGLLAVAVPRPISAAGDSPCSGSRTCARPWRPGSVRGARRTARITSGPAVHTDRHRRPVAAESYAASSSTVLGADSSRPEVELGERDWPAVGTMDVTGPASDSFGTAGHCPTPRRERTLELPAVVQSVRLSNGLRSARTVGGQTDADRPRRPRSR